VREFRSRWRQLYDQREIHTYYDRNSNGGSDPHRQRWQQPADDFANRHRFHHVRGGAFDQNAASQPDGNGGTNGSVYSDGCGHGAADLPVAEERDRDQRRNFILLYNTSDNEFGQRSAVHRRGE